MAVIYDAMVKVNLAFAEHTSDDWLYAVRRLNAGCTARRGLILLIRLQGPDRVGHKHSRAKRSVHKCASNRPFCSTLMGTLVDSVYQHVLACSRSGVFIARSA